MIVKITRTDTKDVGQTILNLISGIHLMGTIVGGLGHRFVQITMRESGGGEVGSCTSATTLTEDIVVSLVSGTMESGFGMAPPDQPPDDGPWDPPDIWEDATCKHPVPLAGWTTGSHLLWCSL